jgi:hypothetical protein
MCCRRNQTHRDARQISQLWQEWQREVAKAFATELTTGGSHDGVGNHAVCGRSGRTGIGDLGTQPAQTHEPPVRTMEAPITLTTKPSSEFQTVWIRRDSECQN